MQFIPLFLVGNVVCDGFGVEARFYQLFELYMNIWGRRIVTRFSRTVKKPFCSITPMKCHNCVIVIITKSIFPHHVIYVGIPICNKHTPKTSEGQLIN